MIFQKRMPTLHGWTSFVSEETSDYQNKTFKLVVQIFTIIPQYWNNKQQVGPDVRYEIKLYLQHNLTQQNTWTVEKQTWFHDVLGESLRYFWTFASLTFKNHVFKLDPTENHSHIWSHTRSHRTMDVWLSERNFFNPLTHFGLNKLTLLRTTIHHL